MQTATQLRGLMTIPQFCEKHSISRAHFYRVGPARVKIGGASRVTPEHEAAWLASLPVVANDAA